MEVVGEDHIHAHVEEFLGLGGIVRPEYVADDPVGVGLLDHLPVEIGLEQLKLLATDGMLVKRPLLIGEDFVLTGFREKEWEEKVLK